MVYCFALSPDDRSEYRRAVSSKADYFVDLSQISDSYQSAQIIYSCNIDILVNLNGYTKGART